MKLDKHELHEDSRMTMYDNVVMQHIHNKDALAVYCYLGSMPEDWDFTKDIVAKQFGLGIKKVAAIFSYLIKIKALERSQGRDKKGRLTGCSYLLKRKISPDCSCYVKGS